MTVCIMEDRWRAIYGRPRVATRFRSFASVLDRDGGWLLVAMPRFSGRMVGRAGTAAAAAAATAEQAIYIHGVSDICTRVRACGCLSSLRGRRWCV